MPQASLQPREHGQTVAWSYRAHTLTGDTVETAGLVAEFTMQSQTTPRTPTRSQEVVAAAGPSE